MAQIRVRCRTGGLSHRAASADDFGSDRYCERWRRDYAVAGTEPLELHHLYRAMAFLGEALTDQSAASALAPRCNKDLIEEDLFKTWRDLFSGLELVFFDTTSIYFEGEGGEALGERGFSKDHRPELKQMVVGVVINDEGRPICCEMWPGNTTDVKTLVTITQGLRQRFQIQRFCIVADRGMISAENLKYLEAENAIPTSWAPGCAKTKRFESRYSPAAAATRKFTRSAPKPKIPRRSRSRKCGTWAGVTSFASMNARPPKTS